MIDIRYIYNNCTLINELYLDKINPYKLVNMTAMFQNCISLSSINFSTINDDNLTTIDNVEDMNYLFNGCSYLSYIKFNCFNTSSIHSYEYIFNGLPENGIFIYDSKIFDNKLLDILPPNWIKTDIPNETS